MKNSNYFVDMPDGYRLTRSIPGNPIGSTCYESRTLASQSKIRIYSIPYDISLLTKDKHKCLEDIYASLSDNEAIIEVLLGVTNEGNDYIYKIQKNRNGLKEETYTLKMQIACEHSVLNIDVFFTGLGREESRESFMTKKLINEGYICEGTDNRILDPYNKNHNRLYLMNLSELSIYDKFFKDNPLSLCRSLVDYIIRTK